MLPLVLVIVVVSLQSPLLSRFTALVSLARTSPFMPVEPFLDFSTGEAAKDRSANCGHRVGHRVALLDSAARHASYQSTHHHGQRTMVGVWGFGSHTARRGMLTPLSPARWRPR
ncbi:hypothetical protein P171DRAFT_118248 [Karstenula rhodostoma CBS 690.94]|uniref:Secreted protein n=1 Tax=Karstenula rhodostoma CBS 690.94 TaxID=1392251 RepID=A0A9P4PBP5_9PLEO|nr:hypothetical protein P171DRAFT_118248 [Karstenula rhodostoma CBS 690.94]